MIFECDASRLEIRISLGHRNNNFFSKVHKNIDVLASDLKPCVKSQKKNLSTYRQKISEIILGCFLVVVFATRVLQNDVFCQALGTENDLGVG